MTYTINYMPVFYIGFIRNYASYLDKFVNDPLFFAKKHVEFLNTCVDTPIKTATMVYNDDIPDEVKQMAVDLTSTITTMGSRTIFRPNGGFSYGGWNDVIANDIENGISHDYHFLTEDDYLPTRSDFYEHFVKRMDENCPFVCCKISPPEWGKAYPERPDAMIREDACRLIYKKYGEVFTTNRTLEYPAGWDTQINYINNYQAEGFELRDISDEFKITTILNCHINDARIYGKEDGETIMMPIILPPL